VDIRVIYVGLASAPDEFYELIVCNCPEPIAIYEEDDDLYVCCDVCCNTWIVRDSSVKV